MPSRPKPFVYRGWYCTNAGGVPQKKLCREEEGLKKAELALARLLVQRADGTAKARPRATHAPGLEGPRSPTVAETYDAFMDVKKTETRKGTYDWYRDKLDAFYERFGTRALNSITYEEGLAYKDWLRQDNPWVKGKTPMKGLGNASVNHHVRAAKTLLEWACKPSRRDKYGMTINPWEELKYLPEKPRERLITDEEFRHLLDHCTDGNVSGGAADFRDMLLVLRHSTLRPGELRLLRWDYVRWGQNVIVFPPEVIKIGRRREPTLTADAERVLLSRKERVGARGDAYVFPTAGEDASGRRTAGASGWHQKADSFSQRFRRLFNRCVKKGLIEQERAGERIVPYSTRHTRITELAGQGHSHADIMHDAGHVNPMTTERYKHLAGSDVAARIRKKDASTAGGED
jgi:integrase